MLRELKEETGLVGEIKMWNKTYYPKGWVAHVEVEQTTTKAWVVDDSKVAEVRWWKEVPPLIEWTTEEFEDLSEWHCQPS
jgi:8-oxo-dGTP pyrophosphatase MutT (NUDIX family)